MRCNIKGSDISLACGMEGGGGREEFGEYSPIEKSEGTKRRESPDQAVDERVGAGACMWVKQNTTNLATEALAGRAGGVGRAARENRYRDIPSASL